MTTPRRSSDPPASNRRQAYRVPVVPEAGLSVLLTGADGQAHALHVVDVSLLGALVEPTGADPGWAPGAGLVVELRLGRETVRLPAQVHRRHGQRYALAFPGVAAGEDLEPPPGLCRIVRALERRWLETRGWYARP